MSVLEISDRAKPALIYVTFNRLIIKNLVEFPSTLPGQT